MGSYGGGGANCASLEPDLAFSRSVSSPVWCVLVEYGVDGSFLRFEQGIEVHLMDFDGVGGSVCLTAVELASRLSNLGRLMYAVEL